MEVMYSFMVLSGVLFISRLMKMNKLVLKKVRIQNESRIKFKR